MSKVLIAGGSGLIGQRLAQLLIEKNHVPLLLSRSARPNAPYQSFVWDPQNGKIDEQAILDADYIINLAGAGIADKRWTPERKKLIIDSRVNTNELFLNSFKKLGKWPKAYLSSAAIGYYGDRGNEWLTETADPGQGFLAESCKTWEASIQQIAKTGNTRTVIFRIGIVFSKKGGALAKMLLPLKFGLSTYFGNGQQWYSWVHIEDICRLFMAGITNEQFEGTYNAVAPNPVTNKALADTLKDIVPHFALVVPAPASVLRLAMGEMADVVLSGSKVSAVKVQEAGFNFKYPELKSALNELMNYES